MYEFLCGVPYAGYTTVDNLPIKKKKIKFCFSDKSSLHKCAHNCACVERVAQQCLAPCINILDIVRVIST